MLVQKKLHFYGLASIMNYVKVVFFGQICGAFFYLHVNNICLDFLLVHNFTWLSLMKLKFPHLKYSKKPELKKNYLYHNFRAVDFALKRQY